MWPIGTRRNPKATLIIPPAPRSGEAADAVQRQEVTASINRWRSDPDCSLKPCCISGRHTGQPCKLMHGVKFGFAERDDCIKARQRKTICILFDGIGLG